MGKDEEQPIAPEMLRDMSVLRLQPGDTIVVRAKQPLTRDMIERLGFMVKDRFPDHQVMVLDSDLEIGVLRPENAAHD